MATPKLLAFVVLCCLAVSACQQPGQNAYGAREVGKVALVKFGVIIAQREVDVIAKNSGGGALVGGLAGGAVGAKAGSGSNQAAAALAGAAIGVVAGLLAEQAVADRKATEFVITLENRQTVTIVQDRAAGDAPLNVGDRVMVQVMGRTQRVLPAIALPTEVSKPKGVTLVE